MHLSERDLGMLAVGAAFVLVICWIAYNETEVKGQPRYEGELATAGLAGVAIESLNTGDHYFHPGYCVPGQTQIFTPHRYPQVSGANVTALIHHGMDAMKRKAPQDADWMELPPGNVMW